MLAMSALLGGFRAKRFHSGATDGTYRCVHIHQFMGSVCFLFLIIHVVSRVWPFDGQP